MAQEMQDTADGRLAEKAASVAAVAAAHASMPAPHAATSPYAAVAASSGNTGPAVAGSGAPDAIDMGTVRKAMAMRVKYRVLTDSGQVTEDCPYVCWVCALTIVGVYIPKET